MRLHIQRVLLLAALFLFIPLISNAQTCNNSDLCVQSASGSITTGNTVSFAANIGAGHTIIGFVSCDSNQSTPTVTGNGGSESFTVEKSVLYNGNVGDHLVAVYNSVGGYKVITVTQAGCGATSMDVIFIEIKTYVGGKDVAAVGTSGSSAAPDSGASATTGSANDVIIGCSSVGSGFPSADTGFTSRVSEGNNRGMICESKTVSATGSYHATFTSANTNWSAVEIILKQSAACSSPSKVVFTGQPVNANVGASLGTVSVTVEDSSNVPCTSDTSTITLSAHSGSTASTLQSSSSLSKAAVAGVATWTDLFVSPNAGSISIDAADGALTGATSNTVTISTPPVYYVDFVGGDDANTGTDTAHPWKHAPGDDSCTGGAVCNHTMQPGDTLVFKGGIVYSGTSTGAWSNSGNVRGVIGANNSGTSISPITYVSGDNATYNWGTGKAILDGGGPGVGAARMGVRIHGFAFLVFDGLEIRNIGVPESDAAGIDVSPIAAGSADNITVRNCLIHDIDWSGAYSTTTRSYGIELNHSSNGLFEKNEFYHMTDKAIEPASGTPANSAANDSNNGTIQYNVIHDIAIHGIVITGNGWVVKNNLFHDIGIPAQDGSTAPNPAFALKVDHGQGNKVFNNVAWNVNAGFGSLMGYQNEFNHNIVYGLGNQSGGPHSGNDEVAFVLYNKDTTWPSGQQCDSNHFYNNIAYYIPSANTQVQSKFIYVNACAGSNNEFKKNVLFALSGDTTATTNRIRYNSASSGNGGTNSYDSVAGFEANFATKFGGTGNVASGNISVDPAFPGGTLGSFTNQPTGFNAGYTNLNQTSYNFASNSSAAIIGITVSSPENVDITGTTRSSFWPGVYDPVANVAPSFINQPTNVNITAVGQIVTFTISVAGTPVITCQWRKNASNIGGQTSCTTLSFTSAANDVGAAFDVVATNGAGSTTSSSATILLNNDWFLLRQHRRGGRGGAEWLVKRKGEVNGKSESKYNTKSREGSVNATRRDGKWKANNRPSAPLLWLYRRRWSPEAAQE